MTENTTDPELMLAVRELVAEVKGLVEQIAELKVTATDAYDLASGMAGEVITRRLIVVDEAGFERVIAGTTTSEGFVHVRGKSDDPAGAHEAMLMASEASVTPSADLIFSARGRNVVTLSMEVDDKVALPGLELEEVVEGEDGPTGGRHATLAPEVLHVAGSCIARSEVAAYA